MRARVLSSSIVNASLNMRDLLYLFTHLERTLHARRRDYLALCTDSKTNLTMQILLRETEGMGSSGPPSVNSFTVPVADPQEVGVTTIAAYSFISLDVQRVIVSACSGILGCSAEWPRYAAVSRHKVVLDAPQGKTTYGVSESCYQSLAVLLVWDLADKDDLNPVKSGTAIKRDIVGAYV